jgi:hypothetical protein
MAELSVVARRGKGDIESCAAVFIRTVSGRKCSWCLELRRAKQVDPTVFVGVSRRRLDQCSSKCQFLVGPHPSNAGRVFEVVPICPVYLIKECATTGKAKSSRH